MIKRSCTPQLLSLLTEFPAVGLIGARQVGKTTLAGMVAAQVDQPTVHLDLERPSDLDRLGEPELYLRPYADRLVILDEIHRRPGLFPVLRSLIDEQRRNGRFLVLGSASPDLMRQSSESLAGRIAYHELTLFSLLEVDRDRDLRTLWTRGGFPDSFLAKTDEASFRWRQAFIQTHLERDMPALGIRVSSTALRRFWQMLAHCHGQLWNGSRVASSLGVSAPTVRHYLDILQDTFMIRQLQPYYANLKKRLVKSPKVYLRDSGLLHALLGITGFDALNGHPSAGASWEGWVIEQVLATMPAHWHSYFYRTSRGAEMDLILFPQLHQAPIAIEIKYSMTPKPTKGFHIAMDDLGAQRAYVIYPGTEPYPLAANTTALPATQIERICEGRRE